MFVICTMYEQIKLIKVTLSLVALIYFQISSDLYCVNIKHQLQSIILNYL